MNIKLTISIILMVIGIAGIIISQTVSFTYEPGLKIGILCGGLGFLVIGGIVLAISLGRTKKN